MESSVVPQVCLAATPLDLCARVKAQDDIGGSISLSPPQATSRLWLRGVGAAALGPENV